MKKQQDGHAILLLSLSKNPGFQCAKAGVLLQFGR